MVAYARPLPAYSFAGQSLYHHFISEIIPEAPCRPITPQYLRGPIYSCRGAANYAPFFVPATPSRLVEGYLQAHDVQYGPSYGTITSGVLNPSHRSKVTVRRRTTLVRLADRSKLLGILLAPQLRAFHITQRAMHSTRLAPSKGHGSFDLTNFPLPPAPKHVSWEATAPIIGVISFYGPQSLWISTSVTAYKHVQQCSAGIGDAF